MKKESARSSKFTNEVAPAAISNGVPACTGSWFACVDGHQKVLVANQ